METFTKQQLLNAIQEQIEMENNRCENFLKINTMYPQLCKQRRSDTGIYIAALLELKKKLNIF